MTTKHLFLAFMLFCAPLYIDVVIREIFFFLDLMNSKMIARRARVKALKKAAKDAKRKNEAEFKVGVFFYSYIK